MDFIKRSDAFKRIKSDLTQGWATGGLLSIAGSIFIFFLIVSEFSAYLAVRTLSEVQMSDNTDAQVRININISMPKLPCQFASLDVKDVIGTNKMNITTNIRKWKIKGVDGKTRMAEMNENVVAPKHEEEDKHPEDPVDKAQVLSNANFNTYVQSNDLVLVNFYAPWCHWSRRLMPTWHNLASVVSKKPYGYNTKIAMVDCTHADAVQTCRQAHINAFPMVAVYRGNVNTHQYYHGDRTTEKFVQFIENIKSKTNHDSVHEALGQKKGSGAVAATGNAAGPEGCLIQGFVMVNKVPGALSIAAHSKHHTIAASLINTTHLIHHFSFGDVPPKRSYGILKGAYDAANKLRKSYWPTTGANHTHEHYIKVVKVVYSGSKEYKAYKYTVNSHEYQDNINYAGAKFTYDLSPMTVVITTQQIPFYHFVTSMCAIIGGVFTVVGLFDSALFATYNAVAKKQAIGKLG